MVQATYKNKMLLTMEPKAISDLSRTRLSRAIDEINDALQEQHAEIQAFRQTMSTLATAVDKLHSGWREYDTAMGRIDVAKLHRRARRLARIMEI